MQAYGMLRCVAVAIAIWTTIAGSVVADDWVVERLRGTVEVRTGGSWQPLQMGDVVSDSSAVRTAESSRVTLIRGAEAIELGGGSEIRIFDKTGQRMTTVMQAYGTVSVEAERLQVQHFSIQTPFLAAIVKGTRFTVTSSDSGSSVEVSRGVVQVQDYVHGVATDITPGQSAVVSQDIMLDVSGAGARAPLVTLDGALVDSGNADSGGPGTESGNNGHGKPDGSPGNGNSGNGNSASGNNNNGNANAHGHDKNEAGNGNGNSNSGGGNSGDSNGNGNAHGHDKNDAGNGNGNTSDGNGNAHGHDKNDAGNDNGNSGDSNGNGNAYGHDKNDAGNGDANGGDKPGNGRGGD